MGELSESVLCQAVREFWSLCRNYEKENDDRKHNGNGKNSNGKKHNER